MSFRHLEVKSKRDFPAPGGDHFYGSGRKTFSCEVSIDGPQPVRREKFKLRCRLFLPDGTESRGLLDDNAWSWDVAGHGNSKDNFVSLPATLTFNFKKATGKLIMVNISVQEVDTDPEAATYIEGTNTTTFWVKSKRKMSTDSSASISTTLSGMKRTLSDSSESSQSCEGSIDTLCQWTEIAMRTMNKVKRSRSTDESDRDSLMEAMAQCHKLRVYDALKILKEKEPLVRSFDNSNTCISNEDEDLHNLLMEFWEDAVQEQVKQPPEQDYLMTAKEISSPQLENDDDLKPINTVSALDRPPVMSRRIYSEGSSKGRVLSQLLRYRDQNLRGHITIS